jgi:hypothetical protein
MLLWREKTSFLLHRCKNGLATTQTRLAGDLTRNLAGDLIAKKVGYCNKKSFVMVAKSNHIVEIAGDLRWQLKYYAIVATSEYDRSIKMLPVMQIHKYVVEIKFLWF